MVEYSLNKCLSGVLLIILVVISDNVVRTDVNFQSRPTTVKTFENETVLLPCYSTERHSRVRWLDDDNNIIADSQLPQYQIQYDKLLHPNGSLEVMNVQLNDTGNYICEVTVGYRVLRQVNSIEVQVAPEVITFPSGVMNVTLGGMFQIVCEAKGVPYPIISWKHNNQVVTNTDISNRRLTVEVRHYDMSGYIECIADNGVGEPASSGLLLLVHFAPEVKIDQPIVHTKSGMEAKIECVVFSYPTAQIHWFHNGKPLIKINNHIATKDNDLTVTEALPSYYSKRRHVLIIRNIRDSDLGRYECKAENTQGLASGNITLSGNPLKPIFESKSQPATPTTKVLSWQTQSLSPVIDYKFRFRQVPTGNESFRRGKFLWNLLTIPADRDTTGPFHTKSYKLEGLNPSSVYEVIIQARNQYGHSDESNALRFSTPGLTDIISSSSTESNEYDSRFELDLDNGIYPAPYNAGGRTQCSLTITTMSFTFIFFCVLLQLFYL